MGTLLTRGGRLRSRGGGGGVLLLPALAGGGVGDGGHEVSPFRNTCNRGICSSGSAGRTECSQGPVPPQADQPCQHSNRSTTIATALPPPRHSERQPAPQPALLQGIQQRHQHARPRRADRMAQGDRPRRGR